MSVIYKQSHYILYQRTPLQPCLCCHTDESSQPPTFLAGNQNERCEEGTGLGNILLMVAQTFDYSQYVVL